MHQLKIPAAENFTVYVWDDEPNMLCLKLPFEHKMIWMTVTLEEESSNTQQGIKAKSAVLTRPNTLVLLVLELLNAKVLYRC